MMKLSWTATAATACVLALSLEIVAVAGWHGFRTRAVTPTPAAQALAEKAPAVALPAPQVLAQLQPATPARAIAPRPEDGYYNQIRARIRWVETRMGGDKLLTPDAGSRVLLAKAAAQRAGLNEVGLGYQDVYGIINAETSWIPRLGSSKDGTPNLGIAQFEPATARALGLRNPNDPVEAIHVAAVHMKEAAEWSAKRISGLKLNASQHALKLREGVSIFYNLSTKGRNTWNGRNTNKLPIETRLHIQNARTGAQRAAELARQTSSDVLFAGN
jgi:hypothetical protein